MDNLATGVPVQIHLETNILQEGQKSNFVFDVTGQLVRVGTNIYIRYQEETDKGNGELDNVFYKRSDYSH